MSACHNTAQAGIVRATALFELGPYLSGKTLPVVRQGLGDSDPLVRLGAVEALNEADPGVRFPLLSPLLNDPLRAVRIRAARALAPLISQALPVERRTAIERGLYEYIAAQRPMPIVRSWMVASLAYAESTAQGAEAAYRAAMKLRSDFTAAYVNLADLYRASDAEGESLLRAALKIDPDSREPHALLAAATSASMKRSNICNGGDPESRRFTFRLCLCRRPRCGRYDR